MPGLCAVANQVADGTASATVRAMIDRVAHFDWFARRQYSTQTQDVSLGLVALPAIDEGAFAESVQNETVVLLDGELYGGAAERARLAARGCRFSTGTDAEVLLHGWILERTAFLARLHGMFAAAIWDGRTRELTIANDRFGLKPVYVTHVPGRLLAASELKALFVEPRVSRSWSREGVAQFFAFGHFLNENTFFESIAALPPAACATYEADRDCLRVERYWTPAPAAIARDRSAIVHALDDSVVAAVARRLGAGDHVGLSLSGGMDARTILGVIPAGRGGVTSVSIGIDGSIDHRIAGQLASIAGVPHHRHVLDGQFLNEFEQHLRQMVLLTDGHYLDQGIVMPTLWTYRSLGIDVLMRGHGGELLHMDKAYAFSLDHEALSASESELEQWLYRHLTSYMLDGVPDAVFGGDLRDSVPALARDSLRRALDAAAAFDPPQQRIWHLFLAQRLHRETATSMQKFGCFCRVRLPYIDNDVVDLVFALPPEDKVGDALQVGILRHRRPEFLRVINSNTSTLPASSALVTKFARARLRAYSKLGVRGYQPYERLGLWLSRELRDLVTRTLLGDEFLGRDLFNADGVRGVVHDHLERRANHTFFLMALLIFELGQRMLDDPSGFADAHAEGIAVARG